MRYSGTVYRPPSEANSYILQATLGCSWNACTYCAMYRDKQYRVRDLDQILGDIEATSRVMGDGVRKVFVADGDPLAMGMDHWRAILAACRKSFPRLRRVSTYATAMNLLAKTPDELRSLHELGLDLLYIGPESGDDATLKRIAKGADHAAHVRAAELAHAAGMQLSAIFLLGVAGVAGSKAHALGSARLASAMDPRFLSLLTVTVIPDTPLARLQETGRYELPGIDLLLGELRSFVAAAEPTDAIFRTNHASNYLPLEGRLPRDRERILALLDAALAGKVPLRPESSRGL